MRQLKIQQGITNRGDAAIDKYLTEIGRLELLTMDEEVELAQRIRHGDEAALKRLVEANLRFVVSVAKQYQNQGMSLNDLIDEGNIGLMKAAQKFDETRGFKFISYAVWWIRQSILQAISEQSRIVRMPLNQVGLQAKISRASTEFEVPAPPLGRRTRRTPRHRPRSHQRQSQRRRQESERRRSFPRRRDQLDDRHHDRRLRPGNRQLDGARIAGHRHRHRPASAL